MKLPTVNGYLKQKRDSFKLEGRNVLTKKILDLKRRLEIYGYYRYEGSYVSRMRNARNYQNVLLHLNAIRAFLGQ